MSSEEKIEGARKERRGKSESEKPFDLRKSTTERIQWRVSSEGEEVAGLRPRFLR